MIQWIVIPTISVLMTITSYSVLGRKWNRRANRALLALVMLFPGALTAVVLSNLRTEGQIIQDQIHRAIVALEHPTPPPTSPTTHG
jgi:Na+/pantothenate symporter